MVNVRMVTIAATILCACNAFAKSNLPTSDEDIDTDAKSNNNLAIVLFKDRKPQTGQHKTLESYNEKAYAKAEKSDLKHTDNKKLAPSLLKLDDYAVIGLDDDADIDLDSSDSDDDSDDDSIDLSVDVLRKSRRKTSKKTCKKACYIATVSVCERCECSKRRMQSMAKKCFKECKSELD